MIFFQKCDSCKQRKLLVMRRWFKNKIMGAVLSRDRLCGKCARKVKKVLQSMQ